MDAIEPFEHQFEIVRRDARSFIEHLQAYVVLRAPCADVNCGTWVGIFGGVVEEIEQNLFEQNRVDLDERQVFGKLELNGVLA